MSTTTETIKKLAAITDASEFERIASSVLRAADPTLYANLSHPGTQPGGKTIKAPFDNVGWSEAADGSRFVCVAHTTTQGDLAGKWLHEPALVKVRKEGGKPTQPSGDLIKAISEVMEARKKLPKLKVTLALTTNAETPSDVRIAVESKASGADITLDIWSVSRIADFLDMKPDGQAIRRHYLGRPIELLSLKVLLEVGYESLCRFGSLPPDAELVERDDVEFSAAHTLLVGDSGTGKSGVCSARIKKCLDSGKPAVVLHHELLESSLTLSDALDAELRRQFPNIEESAGGKALALCRADSPLLVLVEDVNKSSNPGDLLNKLATWAHHSDSNQAVPTHWQLLCPLWLQHMDLLDSKLRQHSNLSVVDVGAYTDAQARSAVMKRAHAAGRSLDDIEAENIARLLGNDALLIALYDFATEADPATVIQQWVHDRLKAMAHNTGTLFDDLQSAVRKLVFEMLSRRVLDPTWEQVKAWKLESDVQSSVRSILLDATVMRLQEARNVSRIAFRHDRVAGHLISQVSTEHLKDNTLPDFLLDPFFAESVGTAALTAHLEKEALLKIMSKSPVVGAYAYKKSVESRSTYEATSFDALTEWLSLPATTASTSTSYRWSVARVLSEIEGKDVGKLLTVFPEHDRHFEPVLAAAFRNGAFQAGAYWLGRHSLGTRVVGQSQLLSRVMRLRRSSLVTYVTSDLRNPATLEPIRSGVLRLAGYLGDTALTDSIQESWSKDTSRAFDSYLWAAGRCCEIGKTNLLEAICDFWEGMPDGDKSAMGTPANNVAATGVSWLFARHAPYEAVPFFTAKARSSAKLNWPLTYMLRAVDHPDAVEHIARFIANRASDQGRFVTMSTLLSDWERHSREDGRQMSALSKQRLLDLSLDESNTESLRTSAFQLWEVTINPGDVEVARKVDAASPLYNRALWARARRQDLTAVPDLLRKIEAVPGYWLQATRHLGSSVLLPGIITALDVACTKATADPESFGGMLAESLFRLQPKQVEDLLVPRWAALGKDPYFVQVAVLTATPTLRALVADSVRHAADPKGLFKHISIHSHWNSQDGGGPETLRQMEAVEPYFVHIDKIDLLQFWQTCTKRNWLDLRRRSLDELVRGLPERYYYLPGEPVDTKELESRLHGERPHLYRWIPSKVDRGAERSDVTNALFAWLESHLGDARALSIAAGVLAEAGTRSEAAQLRQYEADFENSKAIEAVEFSVWSRTLD